MESNAEGNLLEVMDLARTLRQEQLFIQQEQATFAQLTEALTENSASITKVSTSSLLTKSDILKLFSWIV